MSPHTHQNNYYKKKKKPTQGHLGGSVGWSSLDFNQLRSRPQGHGIEHHVGLCAVHGACLGFSHSLSLSLSPSASLPNENHTKPTKTPKPTSVARIGRMWRKVEPLGTAGVNVKGIATAENSMAVPQNTQNRIIGAPGWCIWLSVWL